MALRTTTRIMLFPVLAQAILNSRLSISDNVAFLAAGAYVKDSTDLCKADTSVHALSNHPNGLLRRRHVQRLNHISVSFELPEECLFSLERHTSSPAPLSREPSVAHSFVAPIPLDATIQNDDVSPQARKRGRGRRASSSCLDGKIHQMSIGTVEHVTPNDDTRRSKCNSNDHAYLPNNSTCNTAVGTKPGLLVNKRASLLRKVTSTSNNGHPASVDSLHDSLERRLSRRLSHLPPPNKDIVNRVTALRRYSVSSTSSMTADTIADSYRGTGGHPRVSNGNANIRVTTMLNRRDGNLAKRYGTHLSAETPLAPGFHLAHSPLSSTFYESFIADSPPSPRLPLLPVSSVDSAISCETNPITPRTEFFTNIIQTMTGEEQFAIRSGGIAMIQRQDLAARRKRC